MQIHSLFFALSRQINKQKVCGNNLLFGGNKVIVTYQTKVGLTPNPLAYALGRQYKDNGFGQSDLSPNTILNMLSERKVCKMW